MIDGVKHTKEMAQQTAFYGLRTKELPTGNGVRRDSEIAKWIREEVSTEYHSCSTCRIDIDDKSVTNSVGLVHETEALRVVDASIAHHSVTANLNSPVLVLADKIADNFK
ncbi:MAG: GMC oxidoreductase, partial [Pseudomonadota bacterium]